MKSNRAKSGVAAVLLGFSLMVSACASTPVIKSSEAATPSGRLITYAIDVRAGGNEQLMSLIWDTHTNQYELKVASENETFIRAVLESFVSAGVPALIGGIAGIEISKEGCGSSNCGTIIWNNGTSSSLSQSGSISSAEAQAQAQTLGY